MIAEDKAERERNALLVGLVVIGLIALTAILYRPSADKMPSRLAIPKDAALTAPCEPYIGERWAGPKGPTYLANRGDVIGIEYKQGAPMKLGYRFDHSELGNGTIRFYTITEPEQHGICPPDYVVSRRIVVDDP